jgi:hypothetical protein
MIHYYEAYEKELDLIKELWEKLKRHHQLRSKYFFQDYNYMIFEDRKEELLKKSENGVLRLDLVVDSPTWMFFTSTTTSVYYTVKSSKKNPLSVIKIMQ